MLPCCRLQQPLFSKDLDERIEEEDRTEATTPVKKKFEEERRDERRKREKVTVESLFKADPPLSEKSAVAATANRTEPSHTTALLPPSIVPSGEPASSSLVTAMYPPVRRPVVTVVNRERERPPPDSASVATSMYPQISVKKPLTKSPTRDVSVEQNPILSIGLGVLFGDELYNLASKNSLNFDAIDWNVSLASGMFQSAISLFFLYSI
ncbi:unnamed protein product [Cylicostephanus goldi]|uniref:Uncharacterized protein n=1 Tax=Cylicostephanus goldi TaxID=71465 RepID=A0A3P6RV95_CYLGO|nr:unnamed protein product [Cylicostephanus goldi]